MQANKAGPAANPRILIAAPQGRSGKTTVSLGICAALVKRGMRVQAFKKGPDYIDPSWLSAASGNPCRSLDSFFLPDPDSLKRAFLNGSASADFSLIEGNHGLYDSLELDGQGSSAAVARVLQSPVILVVNAARMSRSAAAMVHGYQTFEPDTPVAAVVLNNVAQGRHEAKLRQAIEGYCNIPVLGALPRSALFAIPDRHLGLVPHGETGQRHPAIEACQTAVENNIDMDALLQIASQNPALQVDNQRLQKTPAGDGSPPVSLGVIRDRVFSFYYPENLEALETAGARLVFIDSLQDTQLPPVDGLYIGGGFPEIFLEELSANLTLWQEISAAVDAGLPVYAECGGLMVLSQRIRWGEKAFEMAGVLPIEVEMTDHPQGHGYVQAECILDNPFFAAGASLRGHEFHHSRIIPLADDPITALRLDRGSGIGNRQDGIVMKNVLACYTHLHAGGTPTWAPAMVEAARVYQLARQQ